MKKFSSKLFQEFPVLGLDNSNEIVSNNLENYFKAKFINNPTFIDNIMNDLRNNIIRYNTQNNIICNCYLLISSRYSHVDVCKHAKIIHLDGVNYCYNYLYQCCYRRRRNSSDVKKILIKIIKSLKVKDYNICKPYELMNIFNNIIPNVDSNIIHNFTKYQLKLKCESLDIQFKSKYSMVNLRMKIIRKLENNHKKVLLTQLYDVFDCPTDIISVIVQFLPVDVTLPERLHIVQTQNFPQVYSKNDCFIWLNLLKVQYKKSWNKQKLLDLVKLYKHKYF
jgi:hypothetical protein